MTDRLTPKQFQVVSEIAYAEAGLVLVEAKASMISARLAKRVRALGLRDLDAYLDVLASDSGQDELPNLLSSLTTNISHFFREAHHYDCLRTEIIPQIKERAQAGEKIRIWSAGCSRGQELFSIAIALYEEFPDFRSFDVRLLGTDIDPAVVDAAQKGRYTQPQTKGLDKKRLATFFTADGDDFVAKPELRSAIVFKKLNLMNAWPMQQPFDVVFCRNVVIYFDAETQERLWSRFEDHMKPGAWLFLGHSERVQSLGERSLKSVGITSYRKMPFQSAATKAG